MPESTEINAFANPDTICPGDAVELSVSGDIDSCMWESANEFIRANCTISQNPTETTVYRVTTWDKYGCESKDQVTVVVNSLYMPPKIPDKTVCQDSKPIDLPSFDEINGMWEGPGVIQNGTAFDPGITGPGEYKIKFTYSDPQTNCNGEFPLIIHVASNPVSNFEPGSVCQNSEATFENTSRYSDVFIWYVNDSLVSRERNLNYTFSGAEVQKIGLVAISGNCKDSSGATIEMPESTEINAFANPDTICPGDAVELSLSGDINKCKWDF